MSNFEKMESQEDASVNFVSRAPEIGLIEARYVQRTDDYFIVYLSSQTGCDKACRMCHLTATGQNKSRDASAEEIQEQAQVVLRHYDQSERQAPLVHYNFMARGEPLDNKGMLDASGDILRPLAEMAEERSLDHRFLISTILPESIGDRSIPSIFPELDLAPEIYYSIYSMDERFRKRWLPRAMNPFSALDRLKEWQEFSRKTPKIHFAFIKGENDSEQSVRNVCKAIRERDLRVNFNIVRYNPYSEKYGQESNEETIQRNVDIMNEELRPRNSRVVPKVGFDVKASCGMFVTG